MSLTPIQIQLATRIDKHVKKIVEKGEDDEELFAREHAAAAAAEDEEDEPLMSFHFEDDGDVLYDDADL